MHFRKLPTFNSDVVYCEFTLTISLINSPSRLSKLLHFIKYDSKFYPSAIIDREINCNIHITAY